MSISNEVVKFIAEIELDAQDRENFLQGLKECDKECSDLRDGILHLQNSLTKLRTEGKEDTKEFKALQDVLDSKTKTLKETTKQADKYSSALGASRMSMNQLKKYAKELQSAMNNMHKESNPEQWAKYEKELKTVNARIKELKNGSAGAKKGMSSMLEDIANGFTIANIALKGFSALADLAKKGWQSFTQETQVWGDWWQMTVTKVNAGWNQFIANIFQGKDVVKASVNDAIKAAADAQLLLDELFERENSLKIQSVQTQTEINQLMATVKDASKSDSERLQAIEQILKKETDLAKVKRDIAQQELEAYQGPLMERTQLSAEELRTVIDNYNANRDKFKLAEEYIALLEREKKLEADIKTEKRATYKTASEIEASIERRQRAEKELQEIRSKLPALATEETLAYKRLLEQYNLGNDELVTNYVNAVIKVEQANTDLTNQEAQLAARSGRLMNEMNAATQHANEQAYNNAKDEAEANYRSELNMLKEQLLNKAISQEEFNTQSAELERLRLEKLKEINLQYGKDITVIDGQILDERLKNQVPEKKDRPVIDLSVSGDLESKLPGKVSTEIESPGLAQTFETEMTALNVLHASKMISEEEFLKEKSALLKKYNKEDVETEQTLWEQGVQGKLQATQMMLDAMGQAVSSAKDAELATLDAKMQAELAAAGDNADKRAEIEAKYEAKKLDVQKKYADVELGINIAQALAQGALAVIQTWAQLGPIAGSVMAAVVAATTAAQVAVMVQQRNAIKNSTVSSSPSSTSSGSNTPSISNKPSNDPTGTTYIRQLSGYSEGGYTGSGGRLEVAGVVHRGEYVVPQPEMRDPAVLAMVASIENRRRRRTSANALPGFAEGGYTGEGKTEQLLTDILRAIESDKKNPIPAYVVYSDLQAKQQTYTNLKRAGALRSK